MARPDDDARCITGDPYRGLTGRQVDGCRVGPAGGVAAVRGAAVRSGLLRRPPAAVSGTHRAAPDRLQPGAGGLLLLVDVLWRGRHRGGVRLELPADLSGADPAVRVRHRGLEAPGAGGARTEHHVDRGL